MASFGAMLAQLSAPQATNGSARPAAPGKRLADALVDTTRAPRGC